MTKTLPRTLALSGFLALLCCVLAAPALAHSELLEASPADGETVTGSPEELRLTFNEPVQAEFSPVEVYDEADRRVDEDDARVDENDPQTIVVGLQDLAAGSYTVEYRVTSADGHPIGGAYGFSVRAPEPETEPETEPEAGPGGQEEATQGSGGAAGGPEEETAREAGGSSDEEPAPDSGAEDPLERAASEEEGVGLGTVAAVVALVVLAAAGVVVAIRRRA